MFMRHLSGDAELHQIYKLGSWGRLDLDIYTLKLPVYNSHQAVIQENHGSRVSQSGFPHGASGREPACQCRSHKRHGFDPQVGKIPWRRPWKLISVFLLRETHGQRSLEGYRPQNGKELNMTEETYHGLGRTHACRVSQKPRKVSKRSWSLGRKATELLHR